MNQATAATPVMTAKASPLTRPTIPSRITTRNALLEPSSRVASARTATVMVWVAALPPWLATIGASTASATIFSQLALEQAEHGGRQEGGGEIDQQPVEAARGDGPDVVGQFFVAGDAAERLEVLVGLFLDDVDDVVDGDDADQPVGRYRRRGPRPDCTCRTSAPPPPGRPSRRRGGGPRRSDRRAAPAGASATARPATPRPASAASASTA